MALRDKLSLYAYAAPNGVLTSMREYGQIVEDLTFSSAAPGGFATLTAKIQFNTKLIPPELRIFANVALVSGSDILWLGRWDEPGWDMDKSYGEYMSLSAMGAAACLQDDPQDFSYTAQTALQIVTDQIVTQRSAYLPIDSDMTQVLPDNPSATFNRPYNGQTAEQVLNDLVSSLYAAPNANVGPGDYTWGVWNHTKNKDASKVFPTWQMSMHLRNTVTCNYTAYQDDIVEYHVRPSLEYSYNAVTLKYRDSTTLQPTGVTVIDSRLAANKSQGQAPFPFRRTMKDASQLYLSLAEATALANSILSEYQNGGYKIEVILQSIRDAAGTSIDLWRVRADQNIFLPSISLAQIVAPTRNLANSNQFYIVQATYEEHKDQSPQITIECSTFTDTAALQITRLQYQQQNASQDATTTGVVQAAGAPETGKCGGRFYATNTNPYGFTVNFKATMVNLPTINLAQTSATNVSSAVATAITTDGFRLDITPTAAGNTVWDGTYTTQGN